MIKRAHTLRALAEIENGRVESEYAQRVYPFVEKQAEQYAQLHRLPQKQRSYPTHEDYPYRV
jgi:hypothetical protein